MQCAFREKETREDILLWVFCTFAILFGPLFQCVAFICFYFTQTTYYGYINIMNILIMQNEWLFSFGVCMLKHWMRRIERKSVLASLSDKQRAKCINQTLHSPNMNYIYTDTKREGKKTAEPNALMSLCESVFGYDLDCLESLTGLMVGAPKPQRWCSSSCLASLEHWHLSNHFQPEWYMKWNVWNVLQMAVWELESSSIIISSSTHYFFPFQTFINQSKNTTIIFLAIYPMSFSEPHSYFSKAFLLHKIRTHAFWLWLLSDSRANKKNINGTNAKNQFTFQMQNWIRSGVCVCFRPLFKMPFPWMICKPICKISK